MKFGTNKIFFEPSLIIIGVIIWLATYLISRFIHVMVLKKKLHKKTISQVVTNSITVT